MPLFHVVSNQVEGLCVAKTILGERGLRMEVDLGKSICWRDQNVKSQVIMGDGEMGRFCNWCWGGKSLLSCG